MIDTSGSHGRLPLRWRRTRSRPSKAASTRRISRAPAPALRSRRLQDSDRVGVLAFTAGTRWALPLATKPDQATVADALNSLTPQGDTEITQALASGARGTEGCA